MTFQFFWTSNFFLSKIIVGKIFPDPKFCVEFIYGIFSAIGAILSGFRRDFGGRRLIKWPMARFRGGHLELKNTFLGDFFEIHCRVG